MVWLGGWVVVEQAMKARKKVWFGGFEACVFLR
jgi:hypothetical protein